MKMPINENWEYLKNNQDKPKRYLKWEIAEKVYEQYCRLYGDDQSLKRIAERGGFGVDEIINYLNKWNHNKIWKENCELPDIWLDINDDLR